MKTPISITPNHRIEGVQFEAVPGGFVMEVRRCLVIHFTSGASAMSSVEFWRTPDAHGASAHIVIDRDGTVIQCRQFNYTCGHAGVSRWRDPSPQGAGTLYTGVNSCSIGIELANAGDDVALATKWSALPLLTAYHRNGGPAAKWEQYPQPQLDACRDVARALVQRYRLDDITGHDCIAPERKNDPGPAFPMEWLRTECGFEGLPAIHKKSEQ